jgi:hypothetical protein
VFWPCAVLSCDHCAGRASQLSVKLFERRTPGKPAVKVHHLSADEIFNTDKPRGFVVNFDDGSKRKPVVYDLPHLEACNVLDPANPVTLVLMEFLSKSPPVFRSTHSNHSAAQPHQSGGWSTPTTQTARSSRCCVRTAKLHRATVRGQRPSVEAHDKKIVVVSVVERIEHIVPQEQLSLRPSSLPSNRRCILEVLCQ